MESAKLEIVIHCAKGLKNVKHLSSMNPYAAVWIAGDGELSKPQETHVAEKGHCNPTWECSMHFNIISINTKSILCFKIIHRGLLTKRKIGEVQVPFTVLLAGDARECCKAIYQVTIPSGKKQGEIIVSHKFSEFAVSSSKDDGSGPSRVTRGLRRKKPGTFKMVTTKVLGKAGYSAVEGITSGVATTGTAFLMQQSLKDEDEDEDKDEDERRR
ncbi:hypothetical protein Lser_V15G29575 [Lactuca serriola]